jgi:hypothetical protein
MFINANNSLVNLEKVSNVNIIEGKNRIVFNMNYSIEMKRGFGTKMISDYVYWDASSTAEFQEIKKELYKNSYFSMNFLQGSEYNGSISYINLNEISSVKVNDDRKRIIFNLSHSVTFKDTNKDERLTSAFVFVDFRNADQFKQYVDGLNNLLH